MLDRLRSSTTASQAKIKPRATSTAAESKRRVSATDSARSTPSVEPQSDQGTRGSMQIGDTGGRAEMGTGFEARQAVINEEAPDTSNRLIVTSSEPTAHADPVPAVASQLPNSSPHVSPSAPSFATPCFDGRSPIPRSAAIPSTALSQLLEHIRHSSVTAYSSVTAPFSSNMCAYDTWQDYSGDRSIESESTDVVAVCVLDRLYTGTPSKVVSRKSSHLVLSPH